MYTTTRVRDFESYAALGVTEIWRYDGRAMTIHHLSEASAEQQYVVETRAQPCQC